MLTDIRGKAWLLCEIVATGWILDSIPYRLDTKGNNSNHSVTRSFRLHQLYALMTVQGISPLPDIDPYLGPHD